MAGAKPIPEGYSSLTPYLIIDGAAAAIEFYTKAFGATERMRLARPDGKIGHAEIVIGGAVLMLADEYEGHGARAPGAFGDSPVHMHLYVPDVDRVTRAAVAAGATVVRPVADQFYGDRSGALADPFGHLWHIATHIEDVMPDEIARRAEAAMKSTGE
ncbi:MAG: VOC family protein [Alphaproteobacteria bacterium]|nr:VOC family protein [Alphaproteobacteria bacterium]MBV9863160.1 VOC family protein [Alphaproteobacteria bacterium]